VSVRGIDPYSPTPPPVPYGFVDLPERPREREGGEPATGLPSISVSTEQSGRGLEDNPPIRSYKGRQVDTYA
jgi:hypothetical protein